MCRKRTGRVEKGLYVHTAKRQAPLRLPRQKMILFEEVVSLTAKFGKLHTTIDSSRFHATC
jgi:hypothetical protein